MAMTRRTFTQGLVMAAALVLQPIKRLAQYAVLRVTYAEALQDKDCPINVAPLMPEEITRTGKWLG